ncbi:MAG: hypothetical protein ACI8RD_014471, partial [Bacillariaceae sp.]
SMKRIVSFRHDYCYFFFSSFFGGSFEEDTNCFKHSLLFYLDAVSSITLYYLVRNVYILLVF